MTHIKGIENVPYPKDPQKYDGLIIGSIIIAAICVLVSTEMSAASEFPGAPSGTTAIFSLLTLPTFFLEVGVVSCIFYAVGMLFRKTIFKSIHLPSKIVRAMLIMLIIIFFGILFYSATRY